MTINLKIKILPGAYAVCQLPPDSEALPPPAGESLYAVIRTSEELTVICPAGAAPLQAKIEPNWRVFKVMGPLDFSLVGILADLSGQLAAAGVSIFALSTYDTDYILVKAAQLAEAQAALVGAGHHINETL